MNAKPHRTVLGERYVCPVCGAQATVVRAPDGSCRHTNQLSLHCCNRAMVRERSVAPVWHCAVCHREAFLARGEARSLQMICCNQPMRQRPAAMVFDA